MKAEALADHPQNPSLEAALQYVAASAAERDAVALPAFPEDAIAQLEAAGALDFNAQPGTRRPLASEELALVRRVARADGSVGRIVDGHLNAIERVAVHAPPALRDRELAAVHARRLRAGVWGGDPRPGEGPRAQIVAGSGGEVLRGVKTFCSGAGGLHRALVLAVSPDGGPPIAAWVDLTDPATVEIDEGWYRGAGLRASVSHRVVFRDAPVLARLGSPGSLTEQPWFGRDAVRTAASWAGMADAAVEAALSELAERPGRTAVEELAAGRLLIAQRTIDVWLEAAARAMDAGSPALAEISVAGRAAIADACANLIDEAARACGSHPFATGSRLDRARRDLELFLLQHRLDPLVTRMGAAALAERAR